MKRRGAGIYEDAHGTIYVNLPALLEAGCYADTPAHREQVIQILLKIFGARLDLASVATRKDEPA